MRRLIVLLALVLVPSASASGTTDQGVRDAFLFAFPVYQIARTRGGHPDDAGSRARSRRPVRSPRSARGTTGSRGH